MSTKRGAALTDSAAHNPSVTVCADCGKPIITDRFRRRIFGVSLNQAEAGLREHGGMNIPTAYVARLRERFDAPLVAEEWVGVPGVSWCWVVDGRADTTDAERDASLVRRWREDITPDLSPEQQRTIERQVRRMGP